MTESHGRALSPAFAYRLQRPIIRHCKSTSFPSSQTAESFTTASSSLTSSTPPRPSSALSSLTETDAIPPDERVKVSKSLLSFASGYFRRGSEAHGIPSPEPSPGIQVERGPGEDIHDIAFPVGVQWPDSVDVGARGAPEDQTANMRRESEGYGTWGNDECAGALPVFLERSASAAATSVSSGSSDPLSRHSSTNSNARGVRMGEVPLGDLGPVSKDSLAYKIAQNERRLKTMEQLKRLQRTENDRINNLGALQSSPLPGPTVRLDMVDSSNDHRPPGRQDTFEQGPSAPGAKPQVDDARNADLTHASRPAQLPPPHLPAQMLAMETFKMAKNHWDELRQQRSANMEPAPAPAPAPATAPVSSTLRGTQLTDGPARPVQRGPQSHVRNSWEDPIDIEDLESMTASMSATNLHGDPTAPDRSQAVENTIHPPRSTSLVSQFSASSPGQYAALPPAYGVCEPHTTRVSDASIPLTSSSQVTGQSVFNDLNNLINALPNRRQPSTIRHPMLHTHPRTPVRSTPQATVDAEPPPYEELVSSPGQLLSPLSGQLTSPLSGQLISPLSGQPMFPPPGVFELCSSSSIGHRHLEPATPQRCRQQHVYEDLSIFNTVPGDAYPLVKAEPAIELDARSKDHANVHTQEEERTHEQEQSRAGEVSKEAARAEISIMPDLDPRTGQPWMGL